MLYDKIEEAFNEADRRHEIASMKINAYIEANLDLLEINYAKAREKVMCEDGTAEDLIYLQEEANTSAGAKLKSAIKKIVEAFKKFCNDIKIKVMSFIQAKDTKDKLDKIEKKVKLNPFLAKKKIQIDDTDKQIGVVAWAHDQYRKLIGKIKSGRVVDREDVEDIKDETSHKMRKAMGAAAVISVSIIGAIALVKKRSASAEKLLKDASDDVDSLANEASGVSEELGADVAAAGTAAVNADAEVHKFGVRAIWSAVTEPLRTIASTISGNIKAEKSSTDDTDNDGVTYTESSISTMLDDIEFDLFGESSDDSDDDFGIFDFDY